MLFLKKGTKVKYIGEGSYILANGQVAEKDGDEMFIKSDVSVQSKNFKIIQEVKEEVKAEVKVEKPVEVKAKTNTTKNKNAKK